ncbi:MAG: hypothetical protein H8E76_03485 [Helicobacteraceae bacterium]|nr:hypothetical protein [Candidatus Sulfurimonas ponti]MBL6973608.1 hypothetical protein [Sulfurimonas sp.]
MKSNISRQNIYLLSLSVFLLIFVLIFAFALLIPEGKEYRNKRADLRKENKELKKYENFRDDVLEHLGELKSENRNIIAAFDRSFDAVRFEKMHGEHFTSLSVHEKVKLENENKFSVYEVNTTSQINSPKSFYNFLDAINKSDWIISVNFPIHFKREAEMIRSSFTMKVYKVAKDTNTSDLNTSE